MRPSTDEIVVSVPIDLLDGAFWDRMEWPDGLGHLNAMVVLYCRGVVLDTRVICKYQCYDLNDQNDSSYNVSDLERYKEEWTVFEGPSSWVLKDASKYAGQ